MERKKKKPAHVNFPRESCEGNVTRDCVSSGSQCGFFPTCQILQNPTESHLNPRLSLSVLNLSPFLSISPSFFCHSLCHSSQFPRVVNAQSCQPRRCYYSVKSYLGPLIILTPVPILTFELRLITFPHKVSTKPTDSSSFKAFQRIAALGIPHANPRKYHFSNMRKCTC